MTTTPTELMETTASTLETLATLATEATATVTEAAAEEPIAIASIKELMDGFDPAALLPELSELFGSLAAVCQGAVMIGPVLLLILGIAYLFFSPKEANYYFGYRCYFGMGSVQAWRFTQRLAGLVLGLLGLVLTIVMLLICRGFAAMEVTDMVWKAVDCLAWQAILALIGTLLINFTAFLLFDGKGEYRRRKRARRKNPPKKKPNE